MLGLTPPLSVPNLSTVTSCALSVMFSARSTRVCGVAGSRCAALSVCVLLLFSILPAELLKIVQYSSLDPLEAILLFLSDVDSEHEAELQRVVLALQLHADGNDPPVSFGGFGQSLLHLVPAPRVLNEGWRDDQDPTVALPDGLAQLGADGAPWHQVPELQEAAETVWPELQVSHQVLHVDHVILSVANTHIVLLAPSGLAVEPAGRGGSSGHGGLWGAPALTRTCRSAARLRAGAAILAPVLFPPEVSEPPK